MSTLREKVDLTEDSLVVGQRGRPVVDPESLIRGKLTYQLFGTFGLDHPVQHVYDVVLVLAKCIQIRP